MKRPLILNPEAEADLSAAQQWYDRQREGLGDEFLSCVDRCLAGIRQNPELHARVFQDLRLALVRRFPYAIIYRIDEDQITIIAVYHGHRDPRDWQQRN